MIVCGTGSRPQHLPCGFDRYHPWRIHVITSLQTYLRENKPDIVISGMAIGWDQILTWAAIQQNIPVHAYIPFIGQEKRWNKQYQKQYGDLIHKCEKVEVVCSGEYAGWKMQRRNERMVDAADLVLALWNPCKFEGGTYNCLEYAKKAGKPSVNFWPEESEL